MFCLTVTYNLYDYPVGTANQELEELIGRPHKDSGLVLVESEPSPLSETNTSGVVTHKWMFNTRKDAIVAMQQIKGKIPYVEVNLIQN
jgi:hypothetical protein